MADIWTLIAAALCASISVRIFLYRQGSATHRPVITMIASALATGTGCYAMYAALTALYGVRIAPVSPLLLPALALLAVLVYRARGNIARVIRLDWRESWDGRERRRGP